MKKILSSLFLIGIVAAAAIGASRAYFFDVETSTNNTITAGDIDISVDNNNPWTTAITIDDMKPSYVRWTRHEIQNVGTNPIKLWKRISEIQTNNNGWSEQECTDAVGIWENNDCTSPGDERDDIDKSIVYDIYLNGQVSGESNDNWLGGVNTGGTAVISETAGITVADIHGVYVYLGELAADASVIVWQSYHMKADTGNWAQTDTMTFTLEYLAQQLNADNPPSVVVGGTDSQAILLENKETTGWTPILGDGIWGVLRWDGDGLTFNFSTTFKGYGLLPSTSYSLIYYADPWDGDNPGAFLGSGTSDISGYLEISGNLDIGYDMPSSPDANYPTGAKIWLVKTADYNGGALSTGPMTGWNPASYLFEYTLISYDDLDGV